jgi:hypothetical protein
MMTSAQTTIKRARLLAALAGGLDFLSGCTLMLKPVWALRLMLLPVPGAEGLVYVRFVGVFVATIGLSYLLALAGAWWSTVRHKEESVVRGLRALFGFTLPFRLTVGTFCLVGVVQGWLPFMWIMVTVADYVLIVLQLWLLFSRWREDEAPGAETEREQT